jgi:phage shock protein A
MKVDLDKAIHAEATLKALAIGKRAEQKTKEIEAAEWRKKAVQLNERINETNKADVEALIIKALGDEKACTAAAITLKALADQKEKEVDSLNDKINHLRDVIKETEDTVADLKARSECADATAAINKNAAGLTLDSSKELIERMKKKVAEKENLSQAYSDLGDLNKSDAEKINDILATPDAKTHEDTLTEFRATLTK